MEIETKLGAHPASPSASQAQPQKRYPEYYVCSANSYTEIVEQVNEKIREGFTMYGSAGYDYAGDNIFQPMIKWVQ